MRILSIDPSSNKHTTSTTGVILLDNATEIGHWVVAYGVDNFKFWFEKIGKNLDFDVVVVEEYLQRENDRARDNTTMETMQAVVECYPNAILQSNTGYKQDVPDKLLKALDLWKFDTTAHHEDIRASARIALFWAMRTDQYEVVQSIGKKALQKK